MKKLLCATLLLFALIGNSQDTISDLALKKGRNHYGIWLLPSWSHNIYGIAIGPLGNEAACGVDYTKYTHGLNIQVPGQGFLSAYYFNTPFYMNDTTISIEKYVKEIHKKTIHNGLLVSVLGTFTDQVNWVSISGFMSFGHIHNGIV